MADDRIRIVVEPDTSRFQQELTSDLNRLDTSVDVEVNANTDDAKVSIERWKKGEQSDPITKEVEVDDTTAARRLQSFAKSASVPVKKVLDFSTEQANKALQSFKSSADRTFRAISKAAKVGAAAAAAAFIGIGVSAGRQFAELEQNLGGSEAVFGKFASRVQKTGIDAYKNLGIAQSDYLAAANKMGSLFQGSGLDQQKSLDLTTKAMQRAADVASVMGLDTSMAMESIAGAAKGNFTMMDNLGVAMNDTALKAFALEKGVNFEWTTATQAQKNELAMRMFFERTEQYAGNFARESEETISGAFGMMRSAWSNFQAALANPDPAAMNTATDQLLDSIQVVAAQVGPLALRIGQNLATKIGEGLGSLVGIDIVGPISTAFGGVTAILDENRGRFSEFGESVKNAIGSAVDFVGTQINKFKSWFDDNRETIMVFKDALVDAFEDIKPAVVELATNIGNLFSTLWNTMKPVLAPLAALVALLVLGITKSIPVLLKIVDVIVRIVTYFLQFKAVIALVLAAFLGLPILIATALGLLVAYAVQHLDQIIAFFKAIPGRLVDALKSLGTVLKNIFVAAFNLALNAAKFIINLYIAYLRAVPLRIIQSLAALGRMLWGFITSVWNRFRDITVNAITAYITLVRSIPGKVLSAIGSVATLLYGKGKDILEGLFDGLKSVWNKIKDWLGGLGDKIKSLKGPIEVDRTLLVDEGRAIMGGFQKGLKSKWDGVEGWLSARGGFIKGILSKVGLADVQDKVSRLLTGEVSVADVTATIDKQSNMGLHASSGWTDTQNMVRIIERLFGVGMTSGLRTYDTVAGPGVSQHTQGTAADFGDSRASHAALDRLAAAMSRLVGKVFSQVIWRNRLWSGGRMLLNSFIPKHLDHVHLGWIPRRDGGQVRKGGNYFVGEEGPEPYIPNSSGFVLSNARLDRMLNVDRRLGMIERGMRSGGGVGGAGTVVHQTNNITMPEIRAADGQGWAMMSTNRLLEMLKANAVSMVGGVV